MRMRLANNENASMPASPLTRLTHGGNQRGATSTPLSNNGAKRATSPNAILPANR